MWMEQLVRTFDNNINTQWNSDIPMAPIAHMVKSAQIEITICEKGNFLKAEEIKRKKAATIIPVTEYSAGRTSSPFPHALCDMLPYVAADYKEYLFSKEEKVTSEEKHLLYKAALKKWKESSYSHPKISSIYAYINKGSLLKDCIQAGVVSVSKDGLLTKDKIEGKSYEKSVVRFRIKYKNGKIEGTWEDFSLIQTYINYYLSLPEWRKDICYMTGKKLPIASIHPKGMLITAYGAKLISSQDMYNFTYRGRFRNAEEAFSLSYEVSQKLHNALAWIIQKYSTYIDSSGKKLLLVWNPEGKVFPDIFMAKGPIKEEESKNTVENYQKNLWKVFTGFDQSFSDNDETVIMSLEASTKGRLAITYYAQLKSSQFLKNIYEWKKDCRWYFLNFSDKKPHYTIESPDFFQIIRAAFGQEKGKYLDVDDKLLKEHVQRLTKCMIERQSIPYYLVTALFNKASMPLAYSAYRRERVLSIACAVITKYHADIKSGEYDSDDDMVLDQNKLERSYLFGRLLALYEKIERSSYALGEKKEPNAISLQNVYVNRPVHTMQLLNRKITPYLQKQPLKRRIYYKNIMDEIIKMINQTDKNKINNRLNENYLLGYYLQRAELNKKGVSENE